MFSRENRRQKRAKFKIYFSFEGCRASVVALSLGRWSCPLGAGLPASGPAGVGSGPLVVCSVPLSLPFVPLLLLLSCISLEICLISHFKGYFSGFCMFGVGLYCLLALRGLWGFCVREWLGGLKA